MTGSPCDGACVETGRLGELCAKRCTSDADCRADEGYVCDAAWHACLLPLVAAPVAARCPPRTPVRDVAFGTAEAWSSAASPGVYQNEPAAVLTDDGGLVALYTGRGAPGEPTALGLVRVDGGSARTLEAAFAPGPGQHAEPRLARGHDGTLYAVWVARDAEHAHSRIALATSRDGGMTWSEARAIDDPADCLVGDARCAGEPMIAVGSDPRTHAERVYVLYAAGANGLRVMVSSDGGATFAHGPIALTGTRGNAVASSDGRLHVVALDGGLLGGYGSAQHAIEYAVSSDDGATFSSPVAVSAPDELVPYFFSNPSLAVDVKRRWLYVAYVRGGRDARWDIVLAASKDGGATWKRTTLAAGGCAVHMVPNLALDAKTGTLHVAYYDSEGAPGRFVHASCGPGVTRCTVHGAIGDQPFAELSLGRLASTWVGEREALLVDDRRRTLHAVWAQTIDEAGRRVTRIFHAAAKLKK